MPTTSNSGLTRPIGTPGPWPSIAEIVTHLRRPGRMDTTLHFQTCGRMGVVITTGSLNNSVAPYGECLEKSRATSPAPQDWI